MINVRLINRPSKIIYNFFSEREQQKVEPTEPLDTLYFVAYYKKINYISASFILL